MNKNTLTTAIKEVLRKIHEEVEMYDGAVLRDIQNDIVREGIILHNYKNGGSRSIEIVLCEVIINLLPVDESSSLLNIRYVRYEGVAVAGVNNKKKVVDLYKTTFVINNDYSEKNKENADIALAKANIIVNNISLSMGKDASNRKAIFYANYERIQGIINSYLARPQIREITIFEGQVDDRMSFYIDIDNKAQSFIETKIGLDDDKSVKSTLHLS